MTVFYRACTFGNAVGCIDPHTSKGRYSHQQYYHCICDTDGCNSAPHATGSGLGVTGLTLISVVLVREYYLWDE